MSSPAEQNETGAVTPMKDFPLAPRDMEWDGDEAEKRIRVESGAAEGPNAAYADCFFWHDAESPDEYGSYKLLYCDVSSGEIEAVPRAIFAVAGILDSARGGTDIPRADQEAIKEVVREWYEKMADEFGDDSIIAPWARKSRS